MADWKETHQTGSSSATVEYASVEKDVICALRNLSKKALRAGGKVIRQKLKASPDVTVNMRNHIAATADIPKDSGQPQLKVGFYGWRKVKDKGKTPSRRNPHWQEFGTKPHQITRKGGGKVLGSNGYYFPASVHHPGGPAMHTLRTIVYDNIDEIRKAQEQHLAALNDELTAALKKEDYSEDIDDD